MPSNGSGYFKTYSVISKKPIKLCADEVVIDDCHINYTGEFEEFEHGKYEICEIKAGTELWAQVMPYGELHLLQKKHDMRCILANAKPGIDFEWKDPNNNPQAWIDSIKRSGPGFNGPRP
jgi:hypothetical protein